MAGAADPAPGAYSFVDRLLHRMAFAHPFVQKALAEFESDLYAARISPVAAERPVFVTGLPRAGTTLLLEMLYATNEFATFTYRDMPFVLAPMLWASLTKSARRPAQLVERAHGDGMQISFDSPEAFEEVLWLSHLRDRYVERERLLPLGGTDLSAEFREAFDVLVRKLIAASGGERRYLSKNNANISRIDAVRSVFPDAAIIICLREPSSHIRSLLTQHQRFSALHASDEFSKSYMAWIGHFDFGVNFRPIDFARRGLSPQGAATANFWLQYWIDAYSFAEERLGEGVHIVCYERLFEDPTATLSSVARAVRLAAPEQLIACAERIRQPTTPTDASLGASTTLFDAANALYLRLRSAAS